MFDDVSVAILAGGRARRMAGRNKALMHYKGAPILARQLAVLAQISDDILLATNDATPYGAYNLPVVPDVRPDLGPLAGLSAALGQSKREYVLLVACDMPDLQRSVIELLLERRLHADIVVPRVAGRLHPTHAVYRRAILSRVAQMLDEKDRSLQTLVRDKSLQTHYIDAIEIQRIDPEFRSFTNINSVTDLP